MTSHPNLFNYATKELSQDAMICWLIEYSGHKDAEGTTERDLGAKFVKALIEKHKGKGYELESIDNVTVHRQDNHIDVLAHINDKHVLLIEDKLGASPDYGVLKNQLDTYWDAVVNKNATSLGKISEKQVSAIYLNTGNISNGHKRYIEENSKYKVFDRKDFLEVLGSYKGDNAIVVDFRSHLESLNEKQQSFHKWRENKYDGDEAWEGLFMELENHPSNKDDVDKFSCDWCYVNNPNGGFHAFYWHPLEFPNKCPAYLQIEGDKLCFKIDADKSGWPYEQWRDKKWEWHERICGQSGNLAKKPKVMRIGKTMTVGVLDGGWLRFDGKGKFDLEKSIELLRCAKRILLNASMN